MFAIFVEYLRDRNMVDVIFIDSTVGLHRISKAIAYGVEELGKSSGPPPPTHTHTHTKRKKKVGARRESVFKTFPLVKKENNYTGRQYTIR